MLVVNNRPRSEEPSYKIIESTIAILNYVHDVFTIIMLFLK